MPKTRFEDPDVNSIYSKIIKWYNAFRNAEEDFSLSDPEAQILLLDFNIIYPFVTPRDHTDPSPESNAHDYYCYKLLTNIENYKHVSKINLCYSPFTIIELFDQLQHKDDYIRHVLSGKDELDIYRRILSILPRIPSSPNDIEEAIDKILEKIGSDTLLSRRIHDFSTLVKNRVLTSVTDHVSMKEFIKCAHDSNKYTEVFESINKYRRPSQN